jgi:hypothetical protein
MREEDIIASGGLAAIVAMSAGRTPPPGHSGHPGRGGHSGGIEGLTQAERRALALEAQMGIGAGTGRTDLDGDGQPGASAPGAPKPPMPPPHEKPAGKDQNLLRRTPEKTKALVDRLLARGLKRDDFVDVRCADFKWRRAQIISITPSDSPAAGPTDIEVLCEVICATGASTAPETVVIEEHHSLGSGNFAPLGTYSDTWIHDYSKVRAITFAVGRAGGLLPVVIESGWFTLLRGVESGWFTLLL